MLQMTAPLSFFALARNAIGDLFRHPRLLVTTILFLMVVAVFRGHIRPALLILLNPLLYLVWLNALNPAGGKVAPKSFAQHCGLYAVVQIGIFFLNVISKYLSTLTQGLFDDIGAVAGSLEMLLVQLAPVMLIAAPIFVLVICLQLMLPATTWGDGLHPLRALKLGNAHVAKLAAGTLFLVSPIPLSFIVPGLLQLTHTMPMVNEWLGHHIWMPLTLNAMIAGFGALFSLAFLARYYRDMRMSDPATGRFRPRDIGIWAAVAIAICLICVGIMFWLNQMRLLAGG